MTKHTLSHLTLLLGMARHTSLHWSQKGLTAKRAVRQINMTLKTLQIVLHVRGVIDTVPRILCYDVSHFVTLFTRLGVHLGGQEWACMRARDQFQYVARPVQMSLEFSDHPGTRCILFRPWHER